MKNLFRILIFMLFIGWITSCNNNTSSENIESQSDVARATALSTLTNRDGNAIQISYFAKDGEVAMKLIVNGEERELTGTGYRGSDNPVFSDGEYVWEMGEDGHSGLLQMNNAEAVAYKEEW